MKLTNISENLDLLNKTIFEPIEPPMTEDKIRSVLVQIKNNPIILTSPHWDYDQDTKDLINIALSKRSTFQQVFDKCLSDNSVVIVPKYNGDVTDEKSATAFIRFLIVDCKIGASFHPDDEIENYGIFSPAEALRYDKLLDLAHNYLDDEVYSVGMEILASYDSNFSHVADNSKMQPFTFYRYFIHDKSKTAEISDTMPEMEPNFDSFCTKNIVEKTDKENIFKVTFIDYIFPFTNPNDSSSFEVEQKLKEFVAGELLINIENMDYDFQFLSDNYDIEERDYDDNVREVFRKVIENNGVFENSLFVNDSADDFEKYLAEDDALLEGYSISEGFISNDLLTEVEGVKVILDARGRESFNESPICKITAVSYIDGNFIDFTATFPEYKYNDFVGIIKITVDKDGFFQVSNDYQKDQLKFVIDSIIEDLGFDTILNDENMVPVEENPGNLDFVAYDEDGRLCVGVSFVANSNVIPVSFEDFGEGTFGKYMYYDKGQDDQFGPELDNLTIVWQANGSVNVTTSTGYEENIKFPLTEVTDFSELVTDKVDRLTQIKACEAYLTGLDSRKGETEKAYNTFLENNSLPYCLPSNLLILLKFNRNMFIPFELDNITYRAILTLDDNLEQAYIDLYLGNEEKSVGDATIYFDEKATEISGTTEIDYIEWTDPDYDSLGDISAKFHDEDLIEACNDLFYLKDQTL